MTKIIMHGCNGKMGSVISNLCLESKTCKIVAGIDKSQKQLFEYPVYNSPSDCLEQADVIIDFSTASAVEDVLNYAVSRKIPIVICTTGLSSKLLDAIKDASKQIPVLLAANTSVGVNLLINLVKKAVKSLDESFDIEIIEKHHNQKIDAPSGTALAIADAINDVSSVPQEYVYDRHSYRKKRSKNEIGIHSLRGGTIVGEHEVIFAGNDEIIEIKHTAMSKNILGTGAIRAGEFLAKQSSGLYSMDNVLDISL